jgi:hypothetical protein
MLPIENFNVAFDIRALGKISKLRHVWPRCLGMLVGV